jgi:hypothetical protein
MLGKVECDREFLLHLFVIIDDLLELLRRVSLGRGLALPSKRRITGASGPGRPAGLSLSEAITLSIFRYRLRIRDVKTYHKHLKQHYLSEFPGLPDYSNFLKAMKRALPYVILLCQLLHFYRAKHSKGPMSIDSTDLPVCKNIRISSHKVCKGLAARSKTAKGWFYGFKLHLLTDQLGNLISFGLTAGNVDDRSVAEQLLRFCCGIVVGDAGYLSKDLQAKLARKGIRLFTAVRKNMKKLMTQAQHTLLKVRQQTESVVSVMKDRLGIETSLPRSIIGHLAHYVYACFAYSIFRTSQAKLLA